MSDCKHELADQDTYIADGYCPLCLLDQIKGQQDEIAERDKRNAELEDKLDRIEQWCRAYPRTVFIEPTKEQWAEANKVLEAHRPACPSLTAISGSNMRHVVEGILALAKDSK
jgi:hypothetical protein